MTRKEKHFSFNFILKNYESEPLPYGGKNWTNYIDRKKCKKNIPQLNLRIRFSIVPKMFSHIALVNTRSCTHWFFFFFFLVCYFYFTFMKIPFLKKN